MAITKPTTENFKFRGESYKEGILLLIEHLTAKDWKVGDKFSVSVDLIKENIQSIYVDYVNCLNENEDASFKENKKHFDRLLKKYNDILLQHTTLKKNSFKSLLVAERCAVWKTGREYFETTVAFASEEGELVQCETPFVDSELLQQEYVKVNNDPKEQPLWFQRLPVWQQGFIKAHWEELSTKSIPSSLRCIPGIANLLRHDFSVNNQESLTYFRHATPFPIELLDQNNEEGFRLTCLNLASQIRLSLEQQVNKSNGGKTQEAVILTQSLLSPGTAATFKSRHISDSSDNDTQIYEMKEKAVELFQQALHLPNAPIDPVLESLFFKEEERESPIYYKDFLTKLGLKVQNNGSLECKGHSFGRITLLSTNHPLNNLRRAGVYPKQTKRNDYNTALLLGTVARYLSALYSDKKASNRRYQRKQNPNILEILNREYPLQQLSNLINRLVCCAEKETLSSDKESLIKILKVLLSDEIKEEFDQNILRLFDALQMLLKIPSGQGSFEIMDKRHRQSLVSAAEAIIINCIGGTLWVACKSGKDRTGGASAADDAAETFYVLRGRYPRYEDIPGDRALYLTIYKDLFESGHHQKVASQNARGANGLVNASSFFPDDLKVDTQRAQLETQLARLNKPKLISEGLAEIFRDQLLAKELQKIKYKVEKKDKGDSNILIDWQRGLASESYFILDKTIKELRNGKQFESEEDLMEFIKEHLLNKMNDTYKECYSALVPSAFHQGGFAHIFGKLGYEFSNNVRLYSGIIYKQADFKINFSPLENGVQIQEMTTCNKKFNEDLKEVLLEKGKYYYQTDSCISVTLNPVKRENYKLVTTVKKVVVNCEAEELKPHFFKKTGFLGFVIEFLVALLAAFKRYVDSVIAFEVAKGLIIGKHWQNSINTQVAKAESAVEHVSEPVEEEAVEVAKDGLNIKTEPEADNRASKQLISPEQEVPLTPVVSESEQFVPKSTSVLLGSHGVFKPQGPKVVDDGNYQFHHGFSAPHLVSVGNE